MSLLRRSAVVVALALLTGSLAHAQTSAAKHAAFATRVDSLAKAYLADNHAPAASIAVVRGRDTLVMAGFGIANIAQHRPAVAGTIYEIGSITKQFTSSAIMRLAEQHKLSIDDEISKYLPQIPLHGHHVTIKQLLNHTSGIHSYTSSPAWRSHWAEDLTPDSIMGFVAKDTFDFAPGTKWSYDNSGYILLGMIIEKVSGESYASYVQKEFFTPLGLTHTSYCPNHPTDPMFAAGYSKSPTGPVPAEYLSLTQPYAAGSLCSTVGDFVKWQRLLASGRVVSPASYARMTTPDTLNNGRRLNYGFGLQPGEIAGHKAITHTGGIPGFATVEWFFPDDTLSVVVFTNFDGVSPDGLARNIARIVFGQDPVSAVPRRPTVPLPPADRDRVVGAYILHLPNADSTKMFVIDDNGTLKVRAFGQPETPMRYYGNLEFALAADASVRFTFHAGANGRVTGVTVVQNDQKMEGVAVP